MVKKAVSIKVQRAISSVLSRQQTHPFWAWRVLAKCSLCCPHLLYAEHRLKVHVILGTG